MLLRRPQLAATETAKYDGSIDVWSYGAVVYEMMSGKGLISSQVKEVVVKEIVTWLGPCPDEAPLDNPRVKKIMSTLAPERTSRPGRLFSADYDGAQGVSTRGSALDSTSSTSFRANLGAQMVCWSRDQ